ncbi:MAG: nucleotide exchange factor GrpE [Candidatus Micrarchaeota archaeon]|nr:nucleotide exchange factor GrpE [Candidatus Micrarchaeota archaeon]
MFTDEEKDKKESQKESEQAIEEAREKAPDESEGLKDRLLRLAAEFDNYKKRTGKEIEASKNLGKAEFAKKLLPTLDEFELAISSMDSSKNDALKGMKLVYSNLVDALKAEGLQEMEAKGKADPYRHEVVMAKESEKEDGTILEVVRKGYMFKDLMIRPASVIVSKGKIGE